MQALRASGLVLGTKPVPMYTYVPSKAIAPYVVLDQVSTVPTTGSRACNHWESVFQLTILTSFGVADQVTDAPTLDILGQLLAALDGVSLPLMDEFQMHPIQVAQTRKASRFNQNSVEVLRYITLKIKVYQDK